MMQTDNRAGSRLDRAVEHVQQGRFTRARAANHRHQLTGVQVETDLIQHLSVAVGFAQFLHRQHFLSAEAGRWQIVVDHRFQKCLCHGVLRHR